MEDAARGHIKDPNECVLVISLATHTLSEGCV